jgi:energy-coupling factor transporter ATP-binding protein EcfA2
VLRQGTTSLSSPSADLDEDELIEAMLGRRPTGSSVATRRMTSGDAMIAARDVSIVDSRGLPRLRNATFDVRGGEIVGVAAVDGSGHRELLRAIAGRLAVSSGTLMLPTSVGFVPDDRHRDGLVLTMSLIENYVLKGAGASRGVIKWRDAATAAQGDCTGLCCACCERRSDGNDAVRREPTAFHHWQRASRNARSPRGRESERVGWMYKQQWTYEIDCWRHARKVSRLCSTQRILTRFSRFLNRVLVVYNGSVREVVPDAELIGRAMLAPRDEAGSTAWEPLDSWPYLP